MISGSRTYNAGRFAVTITPHGDNLVQIVVRQRGGGRTTFVKSDCELGAEPIHVDVKRYVDGRHIFVAIAQKTHFGNTQLFVIDTHKKRIYEAAHCISTLCNHLANGVFEERAMAKYAFNPLPPDMDSTEVLHRQWRFNPANGTFKPAKWTLLRDMRS